MFDPVCKPSFQTLRPSYRPNVTPLVDSCNPLHRICDLKKYNKFQQGGISLSPYPPQKAYKREPHSNHLLNILSPRSTKQQTPKPGSPCPRSSHLPPLLHRRRQRRPLLTTRVIFPFSTTHPLFKNQNCTGKVPPLGLLVADAFPRESAGILMCRDSGFAECLAPKPSTLNVSALQSPACMPKLAREMACRPKTTCSGVWAWKP